MNKKTKEFSDKYNAKKIIEANKDTLIYWLNNKGKWLSKLFDINPSKGEEVIDRFINEMSIEIETYQRWMYLRGLDDKNKS